ncbi:hypothetical protein EVA_03203 [gut metagenome]|uniref:Uncharacterized protein n=1 Tax=gut metagenome TaxID=749906 RepID=J9GZI3_9ZZZZ
MKTKHLTKKKEQKAPVAGLSHRQAKRLHKVTEAEAMIAAKAEGRRAECITLSGVGCRTQKPLIAHACRPRTMDDADRKVTQMERDGRMDHMRRLMAAAWFLFNCTNGCLQLIEGDLEDEGLFRHAFKRYFTAWDRETRRAVELFYKEFGGAKDKAQRLMADRDVFFPQIMKLLGMGDLADEVGHDPSCLPDDLGDHVRTTVTLPEWYVERFKRIATEKNAEARERGEDLRLTYSQVVEAACTKALLSMPEARERGERKLKERYDKDE